MNFEHDSEIRGPYSETVEELLCAAKRATGSDARLTLAMLAELFHRLDERHRTRDIAPVTLTLRDTGQRSGPKTS